MILLAFLVVAILIALYRPNIFVGLMMFGALLVAVGAWMEYRDRRR